MVKVKEICKKTILEKLYKRYNRRELIGADPLQFVYHYKKNADRETAGLISAVLAYGRVEQIEKNLVRIFDIMGASPYGFVKNFDSTSRAKLKKIRYRFTTGDNISDLLVLLRWVLREFGSIERFFLAGYSDNDVNVVASLSSFCDRLLRRYKYENKKEPPRGVRYLLAGPSGGSVSKRLNLFLRWMVRKDDVDPGVWKSIDKSKLIVPIDVHMARLCKILGFYKNKTVSLRAALQITESFAKIEAADPVKYDFALSRIGIIENCNGQRREGCIDCELFEICF